MSRAGQFTNYNLASSSIIGIWFAPSNFPQEPHFGPYLSLNVVPITDRQGQMISDKGKVQYDHHYFFLIFDCC